MSYLKLAKEYLVSNNNILLTDHFNKLWLAGCNNRMKSGISIPHRILGDPHDLHQSLSPNESVIAFKSSFQNLYILTSNKRLVVFRATFRATYSTRDEEYIYINNSSYNRFIDNSSQLALLTNSVPNNSIPIPPDNTSKDAERAINQSYLFERVNTDDYDSSTIPPPSSWSLLSWDDFSRLYGKARIDYISQTQSMINNGIGSTGSWTQSEEKLALAIKQIESNPSESPMPEISHYHLKSISPNINGDSNCKNIYYDVDGIVFGPNRVIFKIGNRFIVEVINLGSSENIMRIPKFKNLPLTKIRMAPNCYMICEACMPKYDEYRFMEHFIYLKKAGSYPIHYLIFPYCGGINNFIQWIKFSDPFADFNPEILHWRRDDNLIYFIKDDVLWCHCNNINAFVETSTRREEVIITRTHFTDYVFKIENDCRSVSSYMSDPKNHTNISIPPYPLTDIQIYPLRCTYLNSGCNVPVVVLNSAPDRGIRLASLKNSVILYAGGLKYYGAINDKMFVYIDQYTMHSITCKCYSIDTTIHHNIYPLPVPEQYISSIRLKENIIIESCVRNYQYIYYAFYCNNFNFLQQLVSMDQKVEILDSDLQLNEHLLFRPQNMYNHKDLSIRNFNNCFMKIMDELPSINTNIIMTIRFFPGNSNSAVGQGVRYVFFTNVVQDFADLYLQRHNHVTEFQNSIMCLSVSQLRDLGKLLVLILCNLSTHLHIRMPLVLIYAIKCKLPTRSDLEFIAELEDAQAFRSLQEIRNDSLALDASGFQDYDSGLRSICKFDLHLEGPAREIAYGFLKNFQLSDITQMNFLTLDHYLSGKYNYDIKRFLGQIRFVNVPEELRDILREVINNLTQAEFSTLLMNWSGRCVIETSLNYTIEIYQTIKKTIMFATCYRTIHINSKIVDLPPYPEFTAIIKPLLIDRCDVMND